MGLEKNDKPIFSLVPFFFINSIIIYKHNNIQTNLKYSFIYYNQDAIIL